MWWEHPAGFLHSCETVSPCGDWPCSGILAPEPLSTGVLFLPEVEQVQLLLRYAHSHKKKKVVEELAATYSPRGLPPKYHRR